MTSLQGTLRSPSYTYDKVIPGKRLTEVTCQLFLQNSQSYMHENVLDARDTWKGALQTRYTALMYVIHQAVTTTQTNLSLSMYDPLVAIIH